MKRLFRSIPLALFCLLLTVLLAGCTTNNYTLAEKKKVQAKGRALMEDYVKSLDGKGRLKEVTAHDYLSWETHRRELDGYAYGTFEEDGISFDFSVNTDTGVIFTSEKSEEFLAVLGRAALDRFGVAWTDCDTAGTFRPVAPDVDSDGRLSGLLPVSAFADLPAYAEAAIGSEEFVMDISVLYTGNPLDFSAFSMDDTAAFGTSRIQFCLVEEKNVHPVGHRRDRDLALALSSVSLTDRKIMMRNYDVCRTYAPYLIQYASQSLILEKDDDGSISARSWDMDPGEDIQVFSEGDRVEFYPYGADQNEEYRDWSWAKYLAPLAPDMHVVIFLEDLSQVGGVEYYLMEDGFRGWIQFRIAQYGDRFVTLNGTTGAYIFNCPDVLVFGEEAERLLAEQEKAGK